MISGCVSTSSRKIKLALQNEVISLIEFINVISMKNIKYVAYQFQPPTPSPLSKIEMLNLVVFLSLI